MKKYLIAGAALVASLSSAVFADNFAGPYAGLTLGANSFSSGYSQAAPAALGSLHSNSSATLFNYGLMTGYGHVFGQYYVGGEMNLSMNNGQTKSSALEPSGTAEAYFSVKEGLSINPALRLGAFIAPKTLAYITLGLAGTQMKVSAIPFGASSPTTNFKKTLWGYSVGAGMETLVTDSISIRGSYTCNIYPTKTFTITGATAATANQGKISPRDNIFRVGAAYHFSF